MSKYQVFGYLPSHKQHSLAPIEPEVMREHLAARGIQPKRWDPENDYDAGGEKVSYSWEFFANEGFLSDTTLACSIWDYKGSRWSAYGPHEAFEALGLTVLGSY